MPNELPDAIAARREELRKLLPPLLPDMTEAELQSLLDQMTTLMLREHARLSDAVPRLDPSALTSNPSTSAL